MAEALIQDIGSDPLLKHAPRETLGSQRLPVLGGVALISKIGSGVSGAVFHGQNRNHGRQVAVKVLPYTDDTSERFLRFIAHAKAARNVKSPRTVEVFDAGDEAGVCYQVMEHFPCLSAEKYLTGLKEKLKPGLSESAMLDVAIAASEGLAAAHAAGLLHLDIRPSCILIPLPKSESGQASGAVGILEFAESKLGDLGLAFNEFSGRLLSASHAETGMPGFLSPEQARGEKNIGKASDVFSLGATFFALLVGQPPFGGLSVEAVLSATLEQPAGDIRTFRPDVSRATTKIVEICLRKDRRQRFADAGILAQALQISRGAMDGTSDIQAIAIQEIEALVTNSPLEEQPTEQTLLLSSGLAAQLAQSSSSIPALTQSQALPRPNDPAFEPTLMSMPASAFKKPAADHGNAADMFTELLKKKVASDQAQPALTHPTAPETDSERTLMMSAPPVVALPKVEPPKPATASATAPAQKEWVDPYKAPPAEKSGSSGWLVASVLVAACGLVAWQQGWLSNSEKPKHVVMASKTAETGPIPGETVATATPTPLKTPAESEAKIAEAKALLDKQAQEENATREKAKLAADAAKSEAAKNSPEAQLARIKKELDEEARRLEEAQKKIAADKAKAAVDAQAKAEAEAAQIKAKAADDAKALAEAKIKQEAELKAAELKTKLEAETKAAAEAALLKTQKEEEAKRAAAEKARLDTEAKAIAEARVKAEDEAARLKETLKREAEAKAAELKTKADAEAKAIALKAKAEAEAKTAEAARLKAQQDEDAKRLAETKAKADADARAAAETAAKKEEEAKRAEARAKAAPVENKKELSIALGEGVKMDFVLVPGGSFTMGTDAAALAELTKKFNADAKEFSDESPAHTVELKPYYIAKTPVTLGQFKRFVNSSGYVTSAEKVGTAYILRDRSWQAMPGASWQKPGFVQRDDHPVVLLSWRDCNAFAIWASREAKRKLRLPTESEWEFAARGAQNSTYPWGDAWDPKLANHADKRLESHCLPDWTYSKSDDGFAFTSPVGKFHNASWCGAFDMAGNVFQWCSDIYDRYPDKGRPPQLLLEDADVPADAKRVLRGGSYLYLPIGCRSAARRNASQKSASVEFGCRLVAPAE